MAAYIVGLVMCLTINSAIGCKLQAKLQEDAAMNRIGVVNGDPAKITNYPFMARYRHANTTSGIHQMSCGAAIINERFLVTAGHCALINFQVDDDTDKRIVTVGADKVEDGEDYEIEKTVLHPYYVLKFGSAKSDLDIAVIKLKKNLTFSERVRPIALASEDLELKSGVVLTAMGFGANSIKDEPSELKTVKLSYVDHKSCRNIFKKYDRPVTHHMLCAGSSKRSSCYGDNGSPIVYNGTLVGITSAVNRFCLYTTCVNLQGVMPGIYTRISALRRFIDNVIERD